MASGDPKAQRPWFEAYPPPKNPQPETVPREELRQWFLQGQKPGKDFILVDVRREDFEVSRENPELALFLGLVHNLLQGGTIKGAVNLPAQSIYPSIPTLYALFKAAGVKKTIWTCSKSIPQTSSLSSRANRP